MTNSESINKINQFISESLNDLADILLLSDADNWAYNLNYTEKDLLNAIVIFNHVSQNIGIKNGAITEQNAESLGNDLRKLVVERTGLDPWNLVKKDKGE